MGQEEGKLFAIRQLIQQGGLKPPVLIFVQSIERAKQLFHELVYDNINVDVMHAERTKAQVRNICTQLDAWISHPKLTPPPPPPCSYSPFSLTFFFREMQSFKTLERARLGSWLRPSSCREVLISRALIWSSITISPPLFKAISTELVERVVLGAPVKQSPTLPRTMRHISRGKSLMQSAK